MKPAPLAWLACLVLPLPASADSDPTGDPPLPGDDALPGLARTGPAEDYAPGALFGYMDGGAEAYLELGVEKLTVQRYRYRGDELVLERFLMSDAIAALGIFWARGGRNAPVLTSPARTFPRLYEGPAQVMRTAGRTFIAVTYAPGKPALQGAARRLLLLASYRVEAPPPDTSLDLLPGAQQVPDSLRIVRGPYALDGFFTLGEGDVLLLKGRATGVAARYQPAPGQETGMLVVPYPSAETARAALDNLAQRLDATLKPVSREAHRLRFQDSEGKFGEASLEGTRLTLRVGLPTLPP